MESNFFRGSEWRKWDLHIHTPASFHWDGARFDTDPKSPLNTEIVDDMISALNKAESAVFAIMDYWTFDGWLALKHRLSQPDAPKLNKTVFPGIELRLMAPFDGRLNVHVLFSDKIDEQVLIDFKSDLKLEFPGRDNKNLSNNALIEYARSLPQDKLKLHGFDYNRVRNDDILALNAGSSTAELNSDSYKLAIERVKKNQAIGFIPFDTNDGLEHIDRNKHYAYVLGLFKSSPIFETRTIDYWEAFSGIKSIRNEKWFDGFQSALNNTPRLAISGSDAHRFVGKPDDDNKRGYGDFPSGKTTWIKANPTFEGLQQAIKEPAKRSFIGEQPPKLKKYHENKSFFIDQLIIDKNESTTISDKWFEKTELSLNQDLVAIIGNKGSGKSALADITALLGNTKQSQYFSFLKKDRFRGKTGEPAKHFKAKIIWADEEVIEKTLNENPQAENVELVKYIPQGHFEALCNAHVSGTSNEFEKELKAVIFSHADNSIRQGALDFDQLIEKQEALLITRLDNLRAELHTINRQIELIETKMSSDAKKSLTEKIAQQHRLIDEHEKTKPTEVIKPNDSLNETHKSALNELADIREKIHESNSLEKNNNNELVKLAAKKSACKNLREQIKLLEYSVLQFYSKAEVDTKLLGIDAKNIIKININEQLISENEIFIISREQEIKNKNQALADEVQKLLTKQNSLSNLLMKPQILYQKYLDELKAWEEKKDNLKGSNEIPDSLEVIIHTP